MSKNKNINLKKKLQAHLLKENQHKSKAKIGKNMHIKINLCGNFGIFLK